MDSFFGLDDSRIERDVREKARDLARTRASTAINSACVVLGGGAAIALSLVLGFGFWPRAVALFAVIFLVQRALRFFRREVERKAVRSILRSMNRCDQCGYDTGQGGSSTCPECGCATESLGKEDCDMGP